MPIAISLSPNTDKEDVIAALKTLFCPWEWKKGEAITKVEDWFKREYKVQTAVSVNSGRTALFSLLKTFGIGQGDEVILQAFTCVAVPETLLWVGAKPVYVDIDDSININPVLLERHISPKTKAIIVQHTFGIPAEIDLIKIIAQKHKLILIEDCAHSLGAYYKKKKVGTFGDAAFFSFGRDKIISSVFGGVAILSSKHKHLESRLKNFQQSYTYPSFFWIGQQLFHPLAFAIILPLYNINIGKIILVLMQKMDLLSKPVYKEEYTGGKPQIFPARYPNALAQLLLVQLKKLTEYNRRRQANAKYYQHHLKKSKSLDMPMETDGAVYLRYNILSDNPELIIREARRNSILLGNWYSHVIDPKDVNLPSVGYKIGSCPRSENIAKRVINLPTYPRLTSEELKEVVRIVNQYAD